MAVPQSKPELLAAITGNYEKLAREFAAVPAERTLEKSLEGHAQGTSMSVHDLAAYLLGWGELVRKWHALRGAEQPVDFPESGFKWNELGRLAQKFYRDYDAIPYPELLQRLEQNSRQIVSLVQSHSDTELYHAPWYEQCTMGRMIQFNTASPYTNACARLRKWKKEQGLT